MTNPRQIALTSLMHELRHHPVNTNIFFECFRGLKLSRAKLRDFVRQYHYFCNHFVKLLEGLLYRTPLDQLEMRIELTRTLFSELGNGNLSRAHISLLNRFAAALGIDEADLSRTQPTTPVRAYLETLQQLFVDSDYLTALGAELAVEVTAASEFQYLYPGLQQYGQDGWFDEDDLEFFRLHIEEEECHGTWLLEAVKRTAKTDGDFDRVANGARQTADAWHAFWLGLHSELFSSAGGLPGAKGPGVMTRKGRQA